MAPEDTRTAMVASATGAMATTIATVYSYKTKVSGRARDYRRSSHEHTICDGRLNAHTVKLTFQKECQNSKPWRGVALRADIQPERIRNDLAVGLQLGQDFRFFVQRKMRVRMLIAARNEAQTEDHSCAQLKLDQRLCRLVDVEELHLWILLRQ